MAKVLDVQYQDLSYKHNEVDHLYGDRVHILKNPYMLTLLNRFSKTETVQPLLNIYLEKFYDYLLSEVINRHFESRKISCPTRMNEIHPEEGSYEGKEIDQDLKVVSVNLARAGILPSHFCYHQLNYFLKPENVRQDHVYINRKVNDKNEVVGVSFSGSKIGGNAQDRFILFPDPMGATGGSISFAIDHYKNTVSGKPKKFFALHLVVTPEYIKRMTVDHPDLEIYALRLDRGFSTEKALKSVPGTYPEEERGLNDQHYIVPGLGGVGEILNNSYV